MDEFTETVVRVQINGLTKAQSEAFIGRAVSAIRDAMGEHGGSISASGERIISIPYPAQNPSA